LFAKVSTTKNEWARSDLPFHLVEAHPPKDGALRNPSLYANQMEWLRRGHFLLDERGKLVCQSEYNKK
jgi:hypothetical protein